MSWLLAFSGRHAAVMIFSLAPWTSLTRAAIDDLRLQLLNTGVKFSRRTPKHDHPPPSGPPPPRLCPLHQHEAIKSAVRRNKTWRFNSGAGGAYVTSQWGAAPLILRAARLDGNSLLLPALCFPSRPWITGLMSEHLSGERDRWRWWDGSEGRTSSVLHFSNAKL